MGENKKKYTPKYNVEYFYDIEMQDVLDLYGIKTNKRGAFSCINKEGHKRGDKNPSASINPHKPTTWHCFSCQAGGNAISFVRIHDKCSFVQALDKLYQARLVDPHALVTEEQIEKDEIPFIPKEIKEAAGILSIETYAVSDTDLITKTEKIANKLKLYMAMQQEFGRRIMNRYPYLPANEVALKITELEEPFVSLFMEIVDIHNKKVDEVYDESPEELYIDESDIYFRQKKSFTKEELNDIFYDLAFDDEITSKDLEKIKEVRDNYINDKVMLPPIPDNILREAGIMITDLTVNDRKTAIINAYKICNKLENLENEIWDDYGEFNKVCNSFSEKEHEYVRNETYKLVNTVSSVKEVYNNIINSVRDKVLASIPPEDPTLLPWDQPAGPSLPWEEEEIDL